MEKYEELKLEVIAFGPEDIISTSGGVNGDDEGEWTPGTGMKQA